MAIVIQEVEAQVSSPEATTQDSPPAQSGNPSQAEQAQMIERQIALIQRRQWRVLAD